MVSIQQSPIMMDNSSIYIPSRLIPSEKIINNCYEKNINRKDFMVYDILGVMGEKRDNLKQVKKSKLSVNNLLPIVNNNLDKIYNYLKNEIHQQEDIKYFKELIESDNLNYKKLAIYLLINGEFNTNKFGIANIRNNSITNINLPH